MKSKVLSTLAVIASCLCLIAVVSVNGAAWNTTLKYDSSFTQQVQLGTSFYTRINASKLSTTKPVVKTTNKVKVLLIWKTIAESEETISQENKNYNNYWEYSKATTHEVTWKNVKSNSEITGRFETATG